MISEDEINQELGRLQDFIINRIKVIKDVINDEDRWVAEEIAMKKQTSNELSIRIYLLQSTPNMIRKYAIISNSGKYI